MLIAGLSIMRTFVNEVAKIDVSMKHEILHNLRNRLDLDTWNFLDFYSALTQWILEG